MDPRSTGPRNALARSRSPYLLQHATNPVDWQEWGPEAFRLARDRGVPIFLSIGYSTCHWCHVMAHESFEDEDIAVKLNAGFVSIKVDREERPDIDRIYMAFVQSLTGSGGWPMSVWLTPDRMPFYGGTYFPPRNRPGRIGFSELIDRIGALWTERRDEILAQGKSYKEALDVQAPTTGEIGRTLAMDSPKRCLEALAQQFDAEWGGFGRTPKFPMPSYLAFLFEWDDHEPLDTESRRLIELTLDRIANGGIRDFIGGGFHRYSVDRYWHVPHFEKMLYDQGQLASIFAESARVLGRKEDLAAAREIVVYVSEQLVSGEGGICSAEDADSPLPDNSARSEEGAFYVWTAEELKGELDGEQYEVFRRVFGIKDEGNIRPESDPQGEFKGKNALMRFSLIERITEELSIGLEKGQQRISEALSQLKAVRSRRPRPHLDDKILASWNGYMISGVCSVYQACGDSEALELAEQSGRFIAATLLDESTGTLYRTFRGDRGDTSGFAEDYASVALAFLDLYESTGDEGWLVRSERLIETLIDRFWDESSHGFFATTHDDESLIARLKDDYDGAEPSANSLAAIVLLKLAAILGDDRYEDFARKTIEAFRYRWEESPQAMALMLVALMRAQRPVQRVVIAGCRDSKEFRTFQEKVFAQRRRHSVLIYLDPDSDWLPGRNKNLAGFRRSDTQPIVYLCQNYVCHEPADCLETLESQLKDARSQSDPG